MSQIFGMLKLLFLLFSTGQQVNTATGGLASTSAMGEGVTESQFVKHSGGGGGGGVSRGAHSVAVAPSVGASGFRAKL